MRKFEKYINDKIFIIIAENELEFQVENLFRIIGKINNDELIDGFTFQVGWSIYILNEEENGRFILNTPDYAKNPFEDITEDLTLALWIQLEQGHFLRKLNIEGVAMKFNDKIILSKGVLDLEKLYLQRTETVEQGDSGWYIGAMEENDTPELYALYAFQLLELKPEIIQILALPYGYLVIIEKEIKAVLNENDENVY